MKENENPITDKKELRDENLEQVTGGIGFSFGMETNGSSIEAAAPAVNAETACAVPAVGPEWVAVEHAQPNRTVGRLEPSMPKPVVPTAPKPTTTIDPGLI